MNRYSTSFSTQGGRRRSGNDAGDGGDDDADGGGSEEPFNATVVVIRAAKVDGRRVLSDTQYWYVVQVVKRLTDFGNKPAMSDLRIAPFGKFWALKLKGGLLKQINLRIYFAVVAKRKQVVVLMAYKKEQERRVSAHVRITLDDRLEDYLAGERLGVSSYRRRGFR